MQHVFLDWSFKTLVFTTRSKSDGNFPSSEDRPRIRVSKRVGVGPCGTRRVPFMTPHRRIWPRGPLAVDLQSAVEQVRGSEIHFLEVLLRAPGSQPTIAPLRQVSGYRKVTTVAVARRLFAAQARHASCEVAHA